MNHLLLLLVLLLGWVALIEQEDPSIEVVKTPVTVSMADDQQDKDAHFPLEETEVEEDLEEEQALALLCSIKNKGWKDAWTEVAVVSFCRASSISVRKVPFYILFVALRINCTSLLYS